MTVTQQVHIPPFPATGDTPQQCMLKTVQAFAALVQDEAPSQILRAINGVPTDNSDWKKFPQMLRNRLRKHPDLRAFHIEVRRPNGKSDLVQIWATKE